MSCWHCTCLLAFIWIIPVTAKSVETVPQQGIALSYPCLGCHPSKGNVISAVPDIYSMNEQQFVQAMSVFQAGTRSATVMGRIAKGYTQADFVSMARFFAHQSGD